MNCIGIDRRPRMGLAVSLVAALAFSACSGGGGSPSGGSTPTPSPAPSNAAAYTCPSSDTVAAVARSSRASSGDAARRAVARGRRNVESASGLIAVTYDRATASSSRGTLEAREQSLGATFVREFEFAHAGVTTRILSVAPAQAGVVEAALRTQAGVRDVGLTERRYPSAVSVPYFTNDPYFNGFTAAQTGGTSTYQVPPYAESATVPGQWDMHAIKLERAFGYSQPNNGSTVTNAGALGSSSVKIALIDTGQDTTHPELPAAKVVHQKCFITNTSGFQSKSDFTTDEDGHGTIVAGVAAADSNNGLGFVGSGGNAALYGYRVYPTPDDNCTDSTSSDPQCGASTVDIASAIEDAVANKVNVINLSFGGGSCTSGQDSDKTERNAIANAIDANIIVVAAAGNYGHSSLDAPACDSGVIAAGASALADGQPNGSGHTGGSAGSPIEYVASYSDYGSPGASVNSPSAWGIVAPGGDPNSDTDPDNLHWIENIYTSTPLDSNFTGTCEDDYPNNGSTPPLDCRDRLAGTSFSAPITAGAAALILSVAPSYQSPSNMKTLLCSTADNINNDPHQGCGRLNVYRAMAQALGDTP